MRKKEKIRLLQNEVNDLKKTIATQQSTWQKKFNNVMTRNKALRKLPRPGSIIEVSIPSMQKLISINEAIINEIYDGLEKYNEQ